jgi:hypothetical protein
MKPNSTQSGIGIWQQSDSIYITQFGAQSDHGNS